MLGTGQSDVCHSCRTDTAVEEVHVLGSGDAMLAEIDTNQPLHAQCALLAVFLCMKRHAGIVEYVNTFLRQMGPSTFAEPWAVLTTGFRDKPEIGMFSV